MVASVCKGFMDSSEESKPANTRGVVRFLYRKGAFRKHWQQCTCSQRCQGASLYSLEYRKGEIL